MSLTAAQFNRRVTEAARHQPLRGIARRAASAIEHPWKVSAGRAGEDWRITVTPGTVNDTAASIGTEPLWRHPVLTVGRDRFAPVPDAQRPAFFRTREMWEFDLLRTSIVVGGVRPFTAGDLLLEIPMLPPTFTLAGLLSEIAFRETLASIGLAERLAMQRLRAPFRVRAANLPPILDGTPDRRIAWLYLVRRRGAPPSRDRIFVQQVEFWNLQAWSALEDQAIGSLVPVLQAMGDIGGLAALEIFKLLLDATRIEWWNS